MRTLQRKPWEAPIDPIVGVSVYDSDGVDETSSLEKPTEQPLIDGARRLGAAKLRPVPGRRGQFSLAGSTS